MRFLNEPISGVTSALDNYIAAHTSDEKNVLEELRRLTYQNIPDPQFIAGHVQGTFLNMVSRMVRPRRILEIGTFTGYSAICFADGLVEQGQIHTIECNEALWDIAEQYIIKAGVEDNVILHKGNALKIIPLLDDAFDLVYIDANKEESCDYYDLVFDKVKKGGFILCDNSLWYGRVLTPEKDSDTLGLHLLNEKIQKDDRVFNILVSIRDGMMLVQKMV